MHQADASATRMAVSQQRKPHNSWRPREGKGDYVFCHNALGQHNVIVDPESLKINAIIDWEFGGFWPEWFERRFWERSGPSAALEGEDDDVERCREWLVSHCDEVIIGCRTYKTRRRRSRETKPYSRCPDDSALSL